MYTRRVDQAVVGAVTRNISHIGQIKIYLVDNLDPVFAAIRCCVRQVIQTSLGKHDI